MTDKAPFHADERMAQRLAGVEVKGGGIHDFMPEQHQTFFSLLPYPFIVVLDDSGAPVASLLTGRPGFVRAVDAKTLRIDDNAERDDPARSGLTAANHIGILGLDLSTRRRNRADGLIIARDQSAITVSVRQSFGNCPQYIQRREIEAACKAASDLETLFKLDDEARALIRRSDTFFVASRSRPAIDRNGGPDISHRGGRPGFVRVAGDRLSIPDFRGNRYFNTLGNILGEPRASLLFINFEERDVLQLQGQAQIDWTVAAAAVTCAERIWHFEVGKAWRRRGSLPWRLKLQDYAPNTEATGLWQDGGYT